MIITKRFIMLKISATLLCFVILSNTPAFAEEITSYAFINNDGTLRVSKKTIHLYGIHIPKTGQNCRTNQQPSVCGSRAALALEFKVKRFVRCEIIDENPNGSLTGWCRVNYSHFNEGEDLSAYLLERGWAVALPDAPVEYHALERIAQSRGIGVWGIPVDRPYIYPFK
jgi:endonuclease YncB( thermonuclease family)